MVFDFLPKFIITGANFTVGTLMKQIGFSWEVRRSGEVALGLWRYRFKGARHVSHPKSHPKKSFVLIPGLGDTPTTWILVFFWIKSFLKDHFDELVFIDFPGFRGFLSQSRFIQSMDLLLAVTHDALDSLEPAVLLGHSLGGWVSASYAIQCGTKKRPRLNQSRYSGPRHLVLVSPSGVCGSEEEWEYWKNLFYQATRGEITLRNRLFAEEPFWLKWILPDSHPFMAREDVVQFVHSIRPEHRVEGMLSAMCSEVSIIWGENDKLIPATWSRKWSDELQGKAKFQFLEKSGHAVQFESPRKLAQAILISLQAELSGMPASDKCVSPASTIHNDSQ